MVVKLKKVHQSWNATHTDEFSVGDELTLNGDTLTSKNGRKFSAKDLCKSYGCSYGDIFEKVS